IPYREQYQVNAPLQYHFFVVCGNSASTRGRRGGQTARKGDVVNQLLDNRASSSSSSSRENHGSQMLIAERTLSAASTSSSSSSSSCIVNPRTSTRG
ncbi:unnamed protein product, partial [Amoebophrya sp. A120]